MDSLDPIEPGLTGLEHAGPAGTFPFLAEGERIWIDGIASRPGLRIGSGTRLLATVETPALGTPANILVFPGVARRDFPSPSASYVETALAVPTLPLAVIQWTSSPGPVRLRMAGASRDSITIRGPTVSVEDPRAEIVLTPSDGEPGVESDTAEGLHLVFRPAREGVVSLVVAFGPDGAAANRHAAAARHAPAHAIRAAAGPKEGLLLRSGVDGADDGVRWLRARIAGQARRLDGEQPMRALAVGLACAAAGDASGAEAALLSEPRSSPVHALLAARHAATFGDTIHARRAAADWIQREQGGSLEQGWLASLAARELADALHLAGAADTIARLRETAGLAENEPASPRGDPPRPERGRQRGQGRRLPMAGDARDDPAAWWSALISGTPRPPSEPRGPEGPGRAPEIWAARALAARFVTEPDLAWVEWRRYLELDWGNADASQPTGPTLWDPIEPAEGSRTAELLSGLAFGMLGLRSDAAAGRLRIAPRLPLHLTRLTVTGLHVGSASVALHYSKSGGTLRYELEPEVATVPPIVVFEPSVAGEVSAVLVDGEPASLDTRSKAGRTTVPLQLPLDDVRVVEIEIDGRPGPDPPVASRS